MNSKSKDVIDNMLHKSTFYEHEKEKLARETGLERIKRMYSLSDYGSFSPEMHYLLRTGSYTVIFAAVIGAITQMNHEKQNFFRRNVASAYESQHLAKRHLTDTMTMSAFKGAFKYSVKYGSFSSLYLLATMTAANYNNKVTVWEHGAAGAMLGSIFRINYGLKGMCVAGSLGGILGLLAGGVLVTSMLLTGSTIEDLRNWQHESFYLSNKKK